MAERLNSRVDLLLYLNGHLLTAYQGNDIQSNPRSPTEYLIVSAAVGQEEVTEIVTFSYTNRYTLKVGPRGFTGVLFTEPVSVGDVIVLVDSNQWGIRSFHYVVGDAEPSDREVDFE